MSFNNAGELPDEQETFEIPFKVQLQGQTVNGTATGEEFPKNTHFKATFHFGQTKSLVQFAGDQSFNIYAEENDGEYVWKGDLTVQTFKKSLPDIGATIERFFASR